MHFHAEMQKRSGLPNEFPRKNENALGAPKCIYEPKTENAIGGYQMHFQTENGNAVGAPNAFPPNPQYIQGADATAGVIQSSYRPYGGVPNL